VKRICRYLPIFVLPLACLPLAHAQAGVDVGLGFGAAQASAAKTGLDPNTLLGCTLGSNPTGAGCASTPALNAFMMGFSGDLMFWKHFGINAEVSFQPAKQNFVTLQPQVASIGQPSIVLQQRTTLYDFNGVYQPVKTEKVALKLYGGVGGANIKFYESSTSTTALTGTQNASQFFGSSNHFQVHGGAAVQIYIKGHLFVRPQFDIHYVNNLTQFGRNYITQEMVWLGYTLGSQ
jgi:Outer membrane protein beta-barrel domain